MNGKGAQIRRALATVAALALLLLPLEQLAQAATSAPGGAPSALLPDVGATAPAAAVPAVTLDPGFKPLPAGSRSPWDGEFQLDGIDGVSYYTPGSRVQVRAMSSNAFFVDEVWLVYPTVKYLFNNKDVPDPGKALNEIQFSSWVDIGSFPPGTELIFGIKTGVGIDDKCQDRTNPDGSVDRQHCYAVTQDPSFVPLAPDPQRVCLATDRACLNKAWPTQTPDGRAIYYTGPGARNVADRGPHGRFQYLSCAVATAPCPAASALTNVALYGLEDVGAPRAPDGSACPSPKTLTSLKTASEIIVSGLPQTIAVSSTAGLGLTVGSKIDIFLPPSQSETVTITAIVGNFITAVFTTPDGKPYPAGTSWAPQGCGWHPDFQDAGVVVWPTLAATCQSTAELNTVSIVGQEGYGTVTLRDSTQTTGDLPGTFKPGDLVRFTVDLAAPISVSGASPSWTINLHGQALMRIEDPTAPATIQTKDASGAWISVPNPNKTIDAGICYDPQFPPPPLVKATIGGAACAASWDFTISKIDANNPAPPSIRVTWTNDQTPPADESATVPLANVDAGGVAHYRSDLNTSLRVVSATAVAPSATWSGTFSLASGPCPKPITADTSAACPVAGATAWDITISGTTQAQAPATVRVAWEGGATATLPLSGAVGVDGVAHYTTTANLATPIASATATIQGAWTGAFTVNGAPCPGKKQLTLTQFPACSVTATAWDFTISRMTPALAPASVQALWTGQTAPEAVALTGTVGADGLAHYTTTAHTGASFLALVSVSATLTFATPADAAAFSGALAAPGVPCAPATPTPTPTPGCVSDNNTKPRPTPGAGQRQRDKGSSGGSNGGNGDGASSGAASTGGAATGSADGAAAGATKEGTNAGGSKTGSSQDGAGGPSAGSAGGDSCSGDDLNSDHGGSGGRGSPTPRPTPTPTPAPPAGAVGECIPFVDPSGKNIPRAGEEPRSGQNPDGFYRLHAPDGLRVQLADLGSAWVGPVWPNDTVIKLVQAPGGNPRWERGEGAVDFKVQIRGDAELRVIGADDNVVGRTTCFVPPRPKGGDDRGEDKAKDSGDRPSPSPKPSPSPPTSGSTMRVVRVVVFADHSVLTLELCSGGSCRMTTVTIPNRR